MDDDELGAVQQAWIRAVYRAGWLDGVYAQAKANGFATPIVDLEVASQEAATDFMLAREEMGLNG